MRRRVVVTGMGVITPSGNSVAECWNAVRAEKTGFADIILLLMVFQFTGRRGTFLSEEQIYNCAVVPSCNVNSIKVKPLPNQPEINIGADL